ncbi:MAG: SpoIIE family protein phosphatase [bacterium]
MSTAITNNTFSKGLTEHRITVLLVDDQLIIGEAVRRMLADEKDINFFFCNKPLEALKTAIELKPTVILQDLVMPDIDGLMLVKFFRNNKLTENIPLIVLSSKEDPKIKAEAFALGANDYMVKLPDKLEVLARIRYHSKAYINLLQRNEAYLALQATQKVLSDEIAEASAYVRSLLPNPLNGPIATKWKFIPSTTLGGDAFGYHNIDEDNFAMYLLDVCGHGVGAALLSISAMNVLRSQSLSDTDFCNPGSVLAGLNKAFPMDKQGDKFFTIWYAVFNNKSRELIFSSGGHPPALLVNVVDDVTTVKELTNKNLAIGYWEGYEFKSDKCFVEKGSKLFIYSDGCFEINMPNGNMMSLDEFKDIVAQKDDSDLIYMEIRELKGDEDSFDDDYSMLEIML